MVAQPKSGIVIQEQCNMADPEEHFLWGVSNVPVGTNMMNVQQQTARLMSKHLHELGFRHHPDLQTKKLQMPVRGQQTFMNGLVRWVPMDSTEPNPLMLPDIQAMTAEEREWMHQELKNVGHIEDPSPGLGPLAQVTSIESVVGPFERRATTAEELG